MKLVMNYNFFSCLHMNMVFHKKRERIYFVCVRKDIYKENISLLHNKKKPISLIF